MGEIPVNISVFTELKVMSQPPRVDILLFRRDEPAWTIEQMARLPDGIKQSTANHILIEPNQLIKKPFHKQLLMIIFTKKVKNSPIKTYKPLYSVR